VWLEAWLGDRVFRHDHSVVVIMADGSCIKNVMYCVNSSTSIKRKTKKWWSAGSTQKISLVCAGVQLACSSVPGARHKLTIKFTMVSNVGLIGHVNLVLEQGSPSQE
jgi:hypothetical protein